MEGLDRLKDALQHTANRSEDADRMAQQLLGVQQQLAQASKETTRMHVSNTSSALASCFSCAPAEDPSPMSLHALLLFLRTSGRPITYLQFPARRFQGTPFIISSPLPSLKRFRKQFDGRASCQDCKDASCHHPLASPPRNLCLRCIITSDPAAGPSTSLPVPYSAMICHKDQISVCGAGPAEHDSGREEGLDKEPRRLAS